MKKFLSLMVLLILINMVNAQVRYSPKAETDIQISILNLVQPTDRTIAFDVYLLDTDPAQNFELGGVQLGLLFNSGIYSGGTISGSYDNSNSGLKAIQLPYASITFNNSMAAYPNKTLMRLASGNLPGAGQGTIISSTSPGTLMTRITLTSTVSWANESQSNIIFTSSNSTSPLYATKISEYIAGVNTELTITSGTNALVCCNPFLNPLGTGVELNNNNSINTYSTNKAIYIDCPSKIQQLSVYNMLGSVVAMEENVSGLRKINLNNFPNECYIVKVITDNNVTTQKILLK